ncbi:MAG: hypothetical protein N2C13_04440 [Chloroflexota bacterium]
MKIRLPWRLNTAENKFTKIETLLSATLQPVAPREDFAKQLRREMVGETKSSMLKRVSPNTLRMGVIGIGAALSGAFIMIAGLRWLISLLGALGLFQLQRKQKNQVPTFPPQAAI